MGPGKDATKQFVDAINENEEVQEMLKNWTKVAAYDLEGEDETFHIIFKADGTAEFKEGAPESPSFTFKAPTDLWAEIQLGKKDAQKEFFAKSFKIEGDVMATMKLTQIGSKLQATLSQ
ncbi:MAG: SCP2 sterol-binding domain-containing protein [Candidatus Heimdallarchaeota archaeon]